ncbi:MAG: hypothetical protein GY820_10550 [Gammaproteobacteria bacterium]|nr:hypothetical protein [Gammaproteobacteria bacterium]
MACLDFDAFKEFILAFDQKVKIDRDKDKKLRYNVWDTTREELEKFTRVLNTSVLKNPNQSPHIKRKMESAITRIKDRPKTWAEQFQRDIFQSDFGIEMSIALHELMESVKGEADKARKRNIEIAAISNTGVLPALPRSRIAASIGRKIAYQKGYRFKRATDEDSSAKIESLYYDIGNEALIQLEKAGYAKLHTNVPTIMDYHFKRDLDPSSRPKQRPTNNEVLSVSLNEKTLRIEPTKIKNGNASSADYFLDRSSEDSDSGPLGVVIDMLKLSRHITQPSTIVLPDTEAKLTLDELAQWDDGINQVDEKKIEARKKMYDKPLFVHDAVHPLMELLNKEAVATGKSATKIIDETFGSNSNMLNSLFGLKLSDNFSIDKKESIIGQNLSKTTPLNDIVDYYDILQDGASDPVGLHMAQKIGRNDRFYYSNSVLNPQTSKQSRYMLTPGTYTVDVGTADFGYLTHQVAKVLNTGRPKDKKLTFSDITGQTSELSKVLSVYDRYLNAKTVRQKLIALGNMSRELPGTDYVQLLTALQAVQDIRSAKGGKVTTQFTVSADATASGGTITFMQALGTNVNIQVFFERIGMFKSETKKDLKDLYGLMSKAIEDFITGEGDVLGPDIGKENVQELMSDTLDMLFIKQGNDVREFSKDPTMTFVYGQGAVGATQTLSHKLADRIIDSLGEKSTREYLAKLFDNKSYLELEGKALVKNPKLKDTKGLYKKIVNQLVKTELPQNLYGLLKDVIYEGYLKEHRKRSVKVWNLVKKMDKNAIFKVLPAGAVLTGKTAAADLNEYGMPVSKTVEVLNTFKGKPDTVLTRRDKVQKTVFDVSPIHSFDAAQMFHSIAALELQAGVISVHDEIRGTVADVRAMQDQYITTTLELIKKYDVHQQMMEAIASQAPSIAALPEFVTLKKQIDSDVAAKKALIESDVFNKDTDALIGDGKAFEEFSGLTSDKSNSYSGKTKVRSTEGRTQELELNEVTSENVTKSETQAGTTEQAPKAAAKPDQPARADIPSLEQNFGDTTVRIKIENTITKTDAQSYWEILKQRLNTVKSLRKCLTAAN